MEVETTLTVKKILLLLKFRWVEELLEWPREQC